MNNIELRLQSLYRELYSLPTFVAFRDLADVSQRRSNLNSEIAKLERQQLEKPDKDDMKADTAKKPEKKSKPRKMNTAAADCARRYRDDGGQTPMNSIVSDYVESNGGKASSIERILADNPDQWKNPT